MLVVEPGYLPYEKEIPDTLTDDEHLRALQEIVGGLILIAMGVKILIEHLTGAA